MDGEERGVLGNLPRSRPGRRSDKRPAEPRADSPPPPRKAEAQPPGDPVGDALRAAGRTAEAGLRTANDLTREILRRLPRP